MVQMNVQDLMLMLPLYCPHVDEATAQDLMPDGTHECPGLDADAATLLSSC